MCLSSDFKPFPDFTILCGNRKVYIEHVGMLDDKDYFQRHVTKVHNYMKFGLMPGRDIFFTYEYTDGSINFKEIDAILEFCISLYS